MKRFVAGVFAGTIALSSLVGCGNQLQTLEPKLELKNAAENFGKDGRAGFTLKAGGSVDDLIAQARKEATRKEPFTASDADMLRKVYNSSFSVSWDRAGAGDADDRAAIGATVDGVAGTELRVVDQVAYLRVPVQELATRFGASAADIKAVEREMRAAVPGVSTLIDGGWVSVSVTDLQKFAATTPGAVPSTDPSQSRKLATDLGASMQALLDGATVVRDDEDENHLVVTTSTVKAYEQGRRLLASLQEAAGKPAAAQLDKVLGSEMDKPPADKPIVVDLWVSDGRFQAVEMNVLQFADGSTGRATVRAELSDAAAIAAPAGAKRLDLTQLLAAVNNAGAGAKRRA